MPLIYLLYLHEFITLIFAIFLIRQPSIRNIIITLFFRIMITVFLFACFIYLLQILLCIIFIPLSCSYHTHRRLIQAYPPCLVTNKIIAPVLTYIFTFRLFTNMFSDLSTGTGADEAF